MKPGVQFSDLESVVKIKMKIVLVLAMLLIGGGYAYRLTEQNRLKEQQVSDYQVQVGQLLSEIEADSRARLQYQRQIDDLQDEVNYLSNQLASVANQLLQVQQGSADIQVLERALSQQLGMEFQQSGAGSVPGLRTVLVKQLLSMEPTKRAEFLSLQNLYGEFLGSLDVGDERMELITGALAHMLAIEKQEREKVLQQIREGLLDPDIIGELWIRIGSQESQLNEMSNVLTEQELTAFSDYRESLRFRPENINSVTFGSIVDGEVEIKIAPLGEVSEAAKAGMRAGGAEVIN